MPPVVSGSRFALLLLAGCPAAEDPKVTDDATPDTDTVADTETDTDSDVDTDTDTDTDTDSDADADTDTDTDTDADADTDTVGDTATDTGTAHVGHAVGYWAGSFEADGTTFVSGSFGWWFWGLDVGDWVCIASGTYSYEGYGNDRCPDCAWSWNLSGLEGFTAVGDACDSPDIDFQDDERNGQVDYGWGFSASYLYEYAGSPVLLEDVIFMFYGGWEPFAYNLPAYGIYQTWGDASAVSFRHLTNFPYYEY